MYLTRDQEHIKSLDDSAPSGTVSSAARNLNLIQPASKATFWGTLSVVVILPISYFLLASAHKLYRAIIRLYPYHWFDALPTLYVAFCCSFICFASPSYGDGKCHLTPYCTSPVNHRPASSGIGRGATRLAWRQDFPAGMISVRFAYPISYILPSRRLFSSSLSSVGLPLIIERFA